MYCYSNVSLSYFQTSVGNCETLVTDAEREVMERTRQWAPWVAPGYNGYDIEYEKDRLLTEAEGRVHIAM